MLLIEADKSMMPPRKTRGDARWGVIVSARSSRTSMNLVERDARQAGVERV
jgi:hypothetical protein